MKNPRVTFSKGEESKRRVLDAALALFSEQGYEKTTMRQIIAKSGVLNGSVYYAFKNKDGIYEYIFDLILDRVYGSIETKDADALTLLLYPAAIKLHAISTNSMLAEMLFHAHRSWQITSNMIARYEAYIREYCTGKDFVPDESGLHRFCLALSGMVSIFADEEYLEGKKVPLETNLKLIAGFVCSMLNLPKENIDADVSAVAEMARTRKSVLADLSF